MFINDEAKRILDLIRKNPLDWFKSDKWATNHRAQLRLWIRDGKESLYSNCAGHKTNFNSFEKNDIWKALESVK
jgi:hypothetical protein